MVQGNTAAAFGNDADPQDEPAETTTKDGLDKQAAKEKAAR